MDCSVPGERLLNLALHFPTLHKLGQLITRNPKLDRKLKKWLIRLAQGDFATAPNNQMALIAKENLFLFHGDLHAGNILAVPRSVPGCFDVALLDWTLAGHLSKKQRVLIMELLLGIVRNDIYTISRILESMTSGAEKKMKFDRPCLAEKIRCQLASKQYVDCEPLKKNFSIARGNGNGGACFSFGAYPLSQIIFYPGGSPQRYFAEFCNE